MKQTRKNGKITKQISTGQIKKEGPGEASVKRNYKCFSGTEKDC